MMSNERVEEAEVIAVACVERHPVSDRRRAPRADRLRGSWRLAAGRNHRGRTRAVPELPRRRTGRGRHDLGRQCRRTCRRAGSIASRLACGPAVSAIDKPRSSPTPRGGVLDRWRRGRSGPTCRASLTVACQPHGGCPDRPSGRATPQLIEFDRWRSAKPGCDLATRRKPTPSDRHQLADRHAAAGHDEGRALVQLAHDLATVVAELTLRDRPSHVDHCSTGATWRTADGRS